MTEALAGLGTAGEPAGLAVGTPLTRQPCTLPWSGGGRQGWPCLGMRGQPRATGTVVTAVRVRVEASAKSSHPTPPLPPCHFCVQGHLRVTFPRTAGLPHQWGRGPTPGRWQLPPRRGSARGDGSSGVAPACSSTGKDETSRHIHAFPGVPKMHFKQQKGHKFLCNLSPSRCMRCCKGQHRSPGSWEPWGRWEARTQIPSFSCNKTPSGCPG